MDLFVSKNRNKEVFESLKGSTILDVGYSDLRDGEDYVLFYLEDGRILKLSSHATNKNDLTWVQAEIKRA